MKRAIGLLLSIGLLWSLTACGTPSAPAGGDSVVPPPAAEGGTRAVYRAIYAAEVETLHYLIGGNQADWPLWANLVEGLVEYDAYGVARPALAESWEHSEDATVWTFRLREGMRWVDADGNDAGEITAADWVAAAAYVLDAAHNAQASDLYCGVVDNAAEYLRQTEAVYRAELALERGEVASVEEYYRKHGIDSEALTLTVADLGVRAEDMYTLVYTLEAPCDYFLSILTAPVFLPVYEPFLQAQGDRFGTGRDSLLYNGPFLLEEFSPNRERVLVKNPAYRNEGQVLIERLEWRYVPDADAAELFRAGEADEAVLTGETLAAWLSDPERGGLPAPARGSGESAFYVFNFNPEFGPEYDPESWRIAVNNENFRQAVRSGLDRVAALSVYDPDNPARLLQNTVTPLGLYEAGGVDYARYEALLPFTEGDSFHPAAALNYRDLAMDELIEAGAVLPVRVLLPYDPSVPGWEAESRAIETQLEALLGAEFIDIIVQAGPMSSFHTEVWKAGQFALLKCTWRAEYDDPGAWTVPFGAVRSLLRQDAETAGLHDDTRNTLDRYAELVSAASGGNDGEAPVLGRTEHFGALARAEAYLLTRAMVIPFARSGEEYRVTRLRPYAGPYAPFGLSALRLTQVEVYEQPIGAAECAMLAEAWQAAYDTAQTNARWAAEYAAARRAAAAEEGG